MNYAKTTFLLALLTCLLVLFGQLLGGGNGALTALVCAALMNFGMFWFSDKIVLAMYRAKQVGRNDAPELFRVVEKLSSKANMPMPRVYIIESNTPNAFATGRSPNKASVAATTGILALLSEEELEGVMAHELAHVQNRDTLISTIAATMAGAITWIANIVQWGALLGSRDDDDHGSGIGALLMALLAPLAALLIQMAISRSREYAADKSGAELSGRPLLLASALGRLHQQVQRIPMQGANPSTAHLFIVNPFRAGGMLNLFSTHPPIEERIKRLKQMAGNR